MRSYCYSPPGDHQSCIVFVGCAGSFIRAGFKPSSIATALITDFDVDGGASIISSLFSSRSIFLTVSCAFRSYYNQRYASTPRGCIRSHKEIALHLV